MNQIKKITIWKSLLPSIVLAIGILASSAIAKQTTDSGWMVLAGPLIMVVSVVIASVLGTRLTGTNTSTFRIALMLGALTVVTAGILWFRDPARLAEAMPMLGVAVAFPFILKPRGGRDRC